MPDKQYRNDERPDSTRVGVYAETQNSGADRSRDNKGRRARKAAGAYRFTVGNAFMAFVRKRMKPLLLLTVLVFLVMAMPPALAERNAPPGPLRSPRHDGSVNLPVWVDIYEGEEEEVDGTVPYEPRADGTIVLVPNSPALWATSVDIGTNRFALSAPLSFPYPITSADVAQIRTVFNASVDRKSVDTLLNEDATALTAAGRVARGGSLSRVELLQVVFERIDGRTFVQNLSIGLDF